ncbi:MAG: hypothetical protein AAFP82_22835, partial [Bacteroidota bacterium]
QQLITDLQGKWKRTTYPFGGVEFKGETVQFIEEEGSTAVPKFEKFVISNQCNSVPRAPHLSKPEAYFFRSNQRFYNKIKIDQDTLFLGSIGPSYSVFYTRVK